MFQRTINYTTSLPQCNTVVKLLQNVKGHMHQQPSGRTRKCSPLHTACRHMSTNFMSPKNTSLF